MEFNEKQKNDVKADAKTGNKTKKSHDNFSVPPNKFAHSRSLHIE